MVLVPRISLLKSIYVFFLLLTSFLDSLPLFDTLLLPSGFFCILLLYFSIIFFASLLCSKTLWAAFWISWGGGGVSSVYLTLLKVLLEIRRASWCGGVLLLRASFVLHGFLLFFFLRITDRYFSSFLFTFLVGVHGAMIADCINNDLVEVHEK